jgi:hypothetical protein
MLPRRDDPGAADRTLARDLPAMAATLAGRPVLVAYRVGLVVGIGVGPEGLRSLIRSGRTGRVDA